MSLLTAIVHVATVTIAIVIAQDQMRVHSAIIELQH